jgi:hypothetical protein
MSTELFLKQFTQHFTKSDFQFLTPDLRPENLRWPRPDQIEKITYREGTGGYPEIRGIARFLGMATTPASSQVGEKVLTTLRGMKAHGETVGFSLEGGAPKVLLEVDAENLNDEQILGRFILISDAAAKFKDFALNIPMGGRWSKHPTTCHVFVSFSSHSKAIHFNEDLEGKCKSYNIFTKAPHVFPWTVDLERKRVKKYSGFPPATYKEDMLEKAFFD